VALRPQVIDLLGSHLIEEVSELGRIGKVAVVQEKTSIGVMRGLVQVVYPLRMERASPSDQPVHRVAFGEQQFGQVGPILPSDAGDQCNL
jgi:hypothetical protein